MARSLLRRQLTTEHEGGPFSCQDVMKDSCGERHCAVDDGPEKGVIAMPERESLAIWRAEHGHGIVLLRANHALRVVTEESGESWRSD